MAVFAPASYAVTIPPIFTPLSTMPYSNFGDDNLHHVAAPMFDPDQSLQPWYGLVAPSLSLAQRDIQNFFDASDDLINNISYDFRTYDSMTAGASQPEPAVVPLASSSSLNAVFPLEQSGSWIIPVQPLEIAQLSPLKPPPYAFQTAAAFPELPSEPFLYATLTSASSSNALSGPDYENGTHTWSAPFFEGGKYKVRLRS